MNSKTGVKGERKGKSLFTCCEQRRRGRRQQPVERIPMRFAIGSDLQLLLRLLQPLLLLLQGRGESGHVYSR